MKNAIRIIARGTVLAVSIACLNAPALAAVDFNSNSLSTLPLAGGTVVSGDYSFASSQPVGVINGASYSSFGVSNGTNMLVFSNQSALTITRTDSGLFNMSSIDVGRWLGLSPGNPAQLNITGHASSGDVLVTASLSSSSFATVATSGFVSLSSLTLSMSGYSSSAYSAIDNLAVTAVPEPETYAMLLAGLGLISLAARRRRGA